MLTFRTISISDREWIQKALQQSQYQGCEYSFANNLAWYRGSDSRIASFQGFYIIAAFDTPDGIPDVTVPSGSGDWDALLRELVETLCPNGSSGFRMRSGSLTQRRMIISIEQKI